jgi:copper chaperone CopZ
MLNATKTTMLALVALLLLCAMASAADPSAEPQDKSACTGTCSTCPGKAQAMLGLAEFKVAVVEAPGLESEELADKVKASIGGLKGVESCVPMVEDHAVWVAYDAKLCGMLYIEGALKALKLNPGRNYLLDPLPKLAGKEQRCVVYAIVPPGAKHDAKVVQGLSGVAGVSAQRLDRMFNMVIANYDPAKVEPQQIKQVLIKLGYPAGLPGEEMTQP